MNILPRGRRSSLLELRVTPILADHVVLATFKSHVACQALVVFLNFRAAIAASKLDIYTLRVVLAIAMVREARRGFGHIFVSSFTRTISLLLTHLHLLRRVGVLLSWPKIRPLLIIVCACLGLVSGSEGRCV